MADKAKTKNAFIISNFNDAGTGESYAACAVLQIDAGAYVNYEAAGLVREPTADETKAKPAA